MFSDEDEIIELEIEIHDTVDKYLQDNGIQQCQPDFYKTMVDKITEEYLEDLICIGFIEEDRPYDKLFKKFRKRVNVFVKNYFAIVGIPRRAYKNPRPATYDPVDKDAVKAQIDALRAFPQPVQRTPEWYQMRHNLITASNIWKAVGSEANQNSLILEKCKPLVAESFDTTNPDSPMHWGVKYEPLTVMIYEYRNKCKVGEFGCIQHPKYPFIGASPDGIVVSDERSECVLQSRLKIDDDCIGRMLEIKNVVSREITGIPKMDYWVQMQVQMEVCNLDACDFIETKFKEYDEVDEDLFYKNKHNYLYNGVILYFIKSDFADGNPHYVYMPLNVELNKTAISDWINETKNALKDSHILFKRIYWYCETYSCILVKRNRIWFDMALPKIQELWSTVEKERISGYEHRKPKKRILEKKCLISQEIRDEVENADVMIES